MTTVVPQSQEGLVNWYATHEPVWSTHFASIGVSEAQCSALKDLVEAAKLALTARELAQEEARSKTEAVHTALAALSGFGAAMMSTIRAYAEATDDPNVYQTALIPAPKPDTPAGPATMPTDFEADPNPDGTITLKWKGTVAQGQSFDIERSVDGGAWVFVKNTRKKNWKDTAVPTNVSGITYRIYGTRNDVRSDKSATAQVLFGTLPPELQAAFRSGPESLAA